MKPSRLFRISSNRSGQIWTQCFSTHFLVFQPNLVRSTWHLVCCAWAAALGPLRSWWCGGVPDVSMVCNSCQDTRNNLAVPVEWFFTHFSYWPVVVVRAYFVFECSGARFVCRESAVFLCVHPFEIIGFGGRGILLLIGVHFPSPEVHFVCFCAVLRFFCVRAVCTAVSLFFAAESASSCH